MIVFLQCHLYNKLQSYGQCRKKCHKNTFFQVNLELINREGAVLTVESLVRQPSGQYKRLELNYRAKWAVNSQYQCDELTEGMCA